MFLLCWEVEWGELYTVTDEHGLFDRYVAEKMKETCLGWEDRGVKHRDPPMHGPVSPRPPVMHPQRAGRCVLGQGIFSSTLLSFSAS